MHVFCKLNVALWKGSWLVVFIEMMLSHRLSARVEMASARKGSNTPRCRG